MDIVSIERWGYCARLKANESHGGTVCTLYTIPGLEGRHVASRSVGVKSVLMVTLTVAPFIHLAAPGENVGGLQQII